jgi:hypothetical protein
MREEEKKRDFAGVDSEVVTAMGGREFHCVPADAVDVTAFREGAETRLSLLLEGPIKTGLYVRLDLDQATMLATVLNKIIRELGDFSPVARPDPIAARVH